MTTLPMLSPCCLPSCDDPAIINIPGPQGEPGEACEPCEDGQNAYTALTVAFTMPAEGASGTATVASSIWMAIGQIVFVQTLGYLEVTVIGGVTSVTLKNIENAAASAYLTNAAPGTIAPIASKVCAGGLQGPDGVISGTAVGAPSDLKGTYPSPLLSRGNSKGMLIVGNGTDAKDLAVGTDGQMLSADATQALGIKWSKPIPITGDTVVADNRVPRLDGATGLPIPLQSSKVEINDAGAIVAIGSNVNVLGLARGTNATDLQVDRAVNTQVASGARAVITGGMNNTAAGTECFVGAGETNSAGGVGLNHAAVVGGQSNFASGQESFVGGGQSNQATSTQATVAGGDTNVASGNESTVGGGNGNTASGSQAAVLGGIGNLASGTGASVLGGAANVASGSYSSVPGGVYALADKWGQQAHASWRFAAAGDAQSSTLEWLNGTVDATPTELFLDGSLATQRATIAPGKAWAFNILVIGRSTAGVSAAWEIKGAIQNQAGVTALVAAVTTTVIADGTGATWGVAGGVVVDADNAADSLRITVTGAATTIRWHATGRICEVGF